MNLIYFNQQMKDVYKRQEVIKQIERKIWTISYDLTKNED